MDAPFQWTKQIASHFGGTGNGLVISWPERIKKGRGVRSPFHHVIDIMPTILEATGLPQSRSINGVTQKPVEGVRIPARRSAKTIKSRSNSPARSTT
jgi:arylsulfatase A-like enzyme